MMIAQKVKIRWQRKKLQIQGAQILRNEAYSKYAAVTKDAGQCSPSAFLRAMSLSNGSWTFCEPITHDSVKGTEMAWVSGRFMTTFGHSLSALRTGWKVSSEGEKG